MKNFINECKLRVDGVNIDRIYKLLLKNNIQMKNIDRPDYKQLHFVVSAKQLKTALKLLDNPSYKVVVEKYYGLSKFLKIIKQRFSFVVVLIVFIVSLVANSCLLNKIEVYGNSTIPTSQIVELLSQNGIKRMSFISGINTDNCEQLILNNFEEIGLVSVAKIGNSLIINIKEKTLNNQLTSAGEKIVSNYNGQIEEMQIIEGTSKYKVGDIVKIGDVLVDNYYINANGEKVKSKANAKIKMKVWFSHSVIFDNQVEVNERTGQKIQNVEYKLCDFVIKKTNKQNNFEKYEQENTEMYVFKNNFLPLKINKTTYYEVETKIITRNFDDYKQSILQECYNKAQEKIESTLTVIKSFDTINKMENGYIVSAYYECEVYVG